VQFVRADAALLALAQALVRVDAGDRLELPATTLAELIVEDVLARAVEAEIGS
jgi:hypothetical protein